MMSMSKLLIRYPKINSGRFFLNVWSIPQIDVNRVVLDLFKFVLVINEKQRFSEHN